MCRCDVPRRDADGESFNVADLFLLQGQGLEEGDEGLLGDILRSLDVPDPCARVAVDGRSHLGHKTAESVAVAVRGVAKPLLDVDVPHGALRR